MNADEARAYLLRTASPGGTMSRQGPELAISRMHPTFVVGLANAIQQARAEGINAGVFSSYRPPGMGVGGFGDKYKSLHAYGLAVDITGLGGAGSKSAKRWFQIAKANGVHNPYGPNNRKEFNHYQAIPDKVAPAALRKTIGPNGPKNLEQMWAAAGLGAAPAAMAYDTKGATPAAIDPALDPFGVSAMQAANAMATNQPPRTLRRGMQGADVDVLGQQLGALGYDTGTPRDKFGSQTEKAIRAFEKASGGFLDVDRRGRGAAGPQVQGALSDIGRAGDITSALSLAPPSGDSITPSLSPQDMAMGGLSPQMPWDLPTQVGAPPPMGPGLPQMAPGGPGPTDLESAMGPSTPPPVGPNPLNAGPRISTASRVPMAPMGDPSMAMEDRPATEVPTAPTVMDVTPDVIKAIDQAPGGFDGTPLAGRDTLNYLEHRAGIPRPPVGNVNYDDAGAADQPQMPPSFADVDWNGPQIERAPTAASGERDIIDRLNPFSDDMSLQNIYDNLFGNEVPAKASPDFIRPAVPSPYGEPSDILPYTPVQGPQSSLMGGGGNALMGSAGSDMLGVGPNQNSQGSGGISLDDPRTMFANGQRDIPPSDMGRLPDRFNAPGYAPFRSGAKIGAIASADPNFASEPSLPPIGSSQFELQSGRGFSASAPWKSPSAATPQPNFGPTGGDPFPPLSKGMDGYVVAPEQPQANAPAFDMAPSLLPASPRDVSLQGSPEDQLKNAMSVGDRSRTDNGAGLSAPGYNPQFSTNNSQTQGWINNYLGSSGIAPGPGGNWGSLFTPSGYQAPDFNPISGGATHAYDPVTRTFITSDGRTLSY